jgi:tetratricopeptide (TPR) repeat protein
VSQLTQYIFEILIAADPFGLEGLGFRNSRDVGAKLTVGELLDKAAEKVAELKDQPLIMAQMADTLGNVYRNQGQFDKAQTLLQQALAIRLELQGEDHTDTAASFYHVAWLLQDQGKLRDAEKLYRKALAIQQKHFGDTSLEAARTMFNLAWLLSDQFIDPAAARYEESEKLFRLVLKIRQEKLGENHREVGFALAALASLMLGKDDKEALALAGQALTNLEKAQNKDAASTTFMKYVFAVQARNQRDFVKADKGYQEVLTQSIEILGDRHPLIGLLWGDYAGMLRQKNDLPGAEKALRKALDIGRKSLLRRHPRMIEGLLELGDYERDRGNVHEADQLYREALEIGQQLGRARDVESAQSRLRSLQKKT